MSNQKLDNGKPMDPSDEFTVTVTRSDLTFIFKALDCFRSEMEKASETSEKLGISKTDNPLRVRINRLDDIRNSIIDSVERKL